MVPGAEAVEVLEVEQHDLARVRGQPAPHRAQDGGDLGAAETVEDAVVGTGGDQQPDVKISEEKENIKEVKADEQSRPDSESELLEHVQPLGDAPPVEEAAGEAGEELGQAADPPRLVRARRSAPEDNNNSYN